MAQAQPDVKGRWFEGDRTLAQQLMGLDLLFAQIEGKSVLDVGCAEGMIAMECAKSGARSVVGIEIREDAVYWARHFRNHDPLIKDKPLVFKTADANTYHPTDSYDIVLLLAVLHKLRDPTAACRRFAAAANDLVVIRLPPERAPSIVDSRSGMRVHNIGVVMFAAGFDLEHKSNDGPFGEWVGFYRRRKHG